MQSKSGQEITIRENNTTFVQAIKISEVGEYYRNLNIDLDIMTTSVSKKRWWSFMIYSFKILGDTIKQLWASKKNSSNSLFHKEKLTKTSTYGFYLYKNSIFLQAYLESLGTLILVVSAFVIFLY